VTGEYEASSEHSGNMGPNFMDEDLKNKLDEAIRPANKNLHGKQILRTKPSEQ